MSERLGVNIGCKDKPVIFPDISSIGSTDSTILRRNLPSYCTSRFTPEQGQKTHTHTMDLVLSHTVLGLVWDRSGSRIIGELESSITPVLSIMPTSYQ